MNKNIVITGTSRGIGFELAQKFANQGHNVLALSRNTKPLEVVNHKNITTLSVDLSNNDDLKKATDFIKKQWNNVDILINNAGKLINKPFTELTTSDFEEVYKVNVFAVAEITKQLIPFMQKGSHVVTVSSMGGVQGSLKFAGLAAYSSAKGAVITLSELLAEEYKEQQIAFNVLALGAVQTEMLEEAFPGYIAPLSAKEMADYIFDFSLTGSKYYNGQVLQVSSSNP
ncbi:SDR family NAD(P)-dependent oxidoreductase [Tenacibaculum finnmarkense]|uniref:SDR family NAD(P)-dependent oxidoreductase n=1 Tax=Tenacibaculum finnmarkense genomovar finnmarkense TaxID=1458503 RepID=A0AAP1WH52_9FLAO|nr:SDR family oxidoreductase [Tenacibaculum finnmarkense]MBE7653734.1 SDR family NAD(P)-dependent oxidoreductase [Tenacibaculum finnmarkense genomovar finnmarkense]MBE7696038.1 SDR family NAD(P)-dependent oxidoreductase [Tenacibaculum finnmarkense genomovar finnmarkense]MCD8428226.1 SDR family oxidoreductase [Tenacibaculum finnmarkense genomovar finnmarkense]MCG8732007.1 SDR family oxidoreductase [Tenacibaculum finnmarkense]MCG8752363.1 SDR family oxidoreductase [Tenacibaculum finnmarkense]